MKITFKEEEDKTTYYIFNDNGIFLFIVEVSKVKGFSLLKGLVETNVEDRLYMNVLAIHFLKRLYVFRWKINAPLLLKYIKENPQYEFLKKHVE